MRILSFSCRNFRNLEEISVSSFDEMNIICGENAQGKTNMLEGLWLFTGMKSFRGAKDSEFIFFGKEKSDLKLSFVSEGVKNDAGLEITARRQASLNGKKLKTVSELAGKFNAVVFSPSDSEIVGGGPSLRRKFIDSAIGQLYPAYISLIKNYTRAVTQRNSIIKDYKNDGSLSVMLDVFENEIAAGALKIIKFRRRYIDKIKNFLPDIYGGISSGRERLDAEYIFSYEGDNLADVLKQSRIKDMYTGSTSVGPHRDDIEFKINGIPARSFGSQGQKRSAALALKLCEAEIIKSVSGEYPVFLLDDVMSELDPERQNYILNHVKGIQTFITCCDPSNIQNLKQGKIISIKNGQVV